LPAMARILSELTWASIEVRSRKSSALWPFCSVTVPETMLTLRRSSRWSGVVRVGGVHAPVSQGLVVVLARADEAVAVGIFEADAGRRVGGKSLRQARPDVDADGGIATLAGVVEVASQPAVGEVLVLVAGGLPDFRGAEVAAVRVGIADAVDDGEMPASKRLLNPVMAGLRPRVSLSVRTWLAGMPMVGRAW
jgi:hypothetical protein